MRRLSLALGIGLVTACFGTAFADPIFDFTIIGGGHTYQFSLPNPPTITDHMHALEVDLGGAGTIDGVSGYTFDVLLILESRGFYGPSFTLDVTPLPAVPLPAGLYGPTLTTLVSDVPNPVPNGDNDLLTFAFVPGDYILQDEVISGFGPTISYVPYSIDIVEEPAALTPEPGTWVLWLTGACALAVALRRTECRAGIGS